MYMLGPLADPAQFCEPIELDNLSTDDLFAMYVAMMRIRLAEEAVAAMVLDGSAKAPCHLGIGQEAVAVAVSRHLTSHDRIYGGHRSHSHYLACGGSMSAMMAEILGKATGAARGMGGSMHLYGPEAGFHGSVPIVGATIGIAAGAALAAQMDGKGALAIAYFGDGACEEGVLHETLNMAAVMKLPLLFVCENNLYSSHLDIYLRQPADAVARFAQASKIESATVDGNDVVATSRAAATLIERARRGEGPGFLEAVTFRWRGHVGPAEDIDVGVRRSSEELAAWKQRDPVSRLEQAMRRDRGVDADRIGAALTVVQQEVGEAIADAMNAPYPLPAALMDMVYAPAGVRA